MLEAGCHDSPACAPPQWQTARYDWQGFPAVVLDGANTGPEQALHSRNKGSFTIGTAACVLLCLEMQHPHARDAALWHEGP